MGKKICTDHQTVILCCKVFALTIVLLYNHINHNPLLLVLLSIHTFCNVDNTWKELKKYESTALSSQLIMLNMKHFAHWMPCRTLKMRPRAVQKKSEYESLRNPVEKLSRCEWTNWRRKSGQTGGATKCAAAATWNDLRKLTQCPGLVHMMQKPMICVMWGGTIHFFSARSLWSKITRSQGIRSPDPLPKWVGEPD